MYYSFLKEEYQKKKDKNSLKVHQLYTLKKIREALNTGNLPRGGWLDDTPVLGPPTQPTAEFKQDKLARIIDQNRDQLKELLKDDLSLYNLEHPCGDFGKCDMVYMGKDTVYPLELKKDQGRHDLIGQIIKYDLYHRFRLHYRHYDFVQSVTICSSYEPYTLKELKKLRVKTIVYSIVKDKLSLKLL
jgi:hypothetical protein